MEDDTVRDSYATEAGSVCDPATVEWLGSWNEQPRDRSPGELSREV